MEPPTPDFVERLAALAAESGIRRISVLAWRDLDDPEAGGSEVHVARISSLWAQAGIDVTMRTSHAPGHPQVVWRDGYRVIRKAGRYLVFPRAVFSEMMRWHGDRDALVEIWNGMPWFSPLWANGPHCVWLHHVHDTMWEMTLPPRLAKLGRTLEFKVAPPFYRGTEIVTLSESSRRELVEKLHFKPKRIHVVPVGIDTQYSAGGRKSPDPLVVAVGRLVPVKRFDVLVHALIAAKQQVPALRAIFVGDGYEREALLAQIEAAGASEWLTLAGWVSDREKIDLYRQAWLVAGASAHEGWGMTLTEAAACGTPSVATRIAGHEDAVAEGKSGLLADDDAALVPAIVSILSDSGLRERLSAGALEHAARFTWGATALGTLEVLAADARRRPR
jgi:glycosyltransferase involved in cell wall biosynthesis